MKEQAALAAAEGRARELLADAARLLADEGMPRLEPRGKLIRPVVALAGAGHGALPPGFAAAVAAVQMAHEASLVHDDIVDRAVERRGGPSVVAERGVAGALVQGDHLLTAAYRLAAVAGSLPFVTVFARSVERTVAGEVRQAAAVGRRIAGAEQRAIAEGKSGELFGCALATAALLRGEDAEPQLAAGRAFGVAYQLLDDLLDYLPGAATGKPALTDYRERHWTWPLDLLGLKDFDADPGRVAALLNALDDSGRRPVERAVARMDAAFEEVRRSFERAHASSPILEELLASWRTGLVEAVERTPGAARARPLRSAPTLHAAHSWPSLPEPVRFAHTLASGSRSFRFAARLFPAVDRDRIAGVYSFCRYTDDLVDRADGLDVAAVEERLDAWVALARAAYEGERTGIALLDVVMTDAARCGVPFRYVADLVDGMRMDLRPCTYADLTELRRYTYRAASVVGLWLTELHGVRDEPVLERAATMGHAMQLTNILRDVGEDLDAGRLYLPLDLMDAHGLDRDALHRMRRDGRILPGYRDLLEILMSVAESWYAEAFAALPALPRSLRRPVAVAAHVYRGIHEGIRRNGYDNLRQRAYTTPVDKTVLGVRALLELRRARRRGQVSLAALDSLPELARAAALDEMPRAAIR